ncbi:MAG: biotin--[acetyl-CoA-carboxylase] ligase [Firmicutes bacterium]|nr:biotin--[acetyl-CoA-carboxylase] ligase [Bacillota bacterium]
MDVPDILNEYEIRHNLNTRILGREVYYLKSVDSTNNYAKQIASGGCQDGTVVVADMQTAGKGRLGKSWDSPDKKGIWMSIVLKPLIEPSKVQIITLAASVAVVSGIMHTVGVRGGIKWPNDIILEGKKVCGILTEMNSEQDKVNYVIVGIGVNVNQDVGDFQEGLRGKAISLKSYREIAGMPDTQLKRRDIIKGILVEMEKVYNLIKKGETREIINKWREFSIVLGKEIRVISGNNEYTGRVEDITDDGKLVIKAADGAIHKLVSGEVSIRGLDEYSMQ